MFAVVFAYVMLSLPFGLLGGIPFLDHFYVQDHSVMYMSRTTVLSVMFLARSALMICPGPRRSRLLCLRAGLLQCPVFPLFNLERVSRLRFFSCEIKIRFPRVERLL